MSTLGVVVEVPIASFRMPYAREYAESYEMPPPATIYGMLLSIVGEVDRYRHVGARIAVARAEDRPPPMRSTVLRTFRRIKKLPVSDPTNARPDFQEILTDVHAAVWVDSSFEADPASGLAVRLDRAFEDPAAIVRFGGLSLGESRDLVDAVWPLRRFASEPGSAYRAGAPCQWLTRDDRGPITMPYWVDHVGSSGTRWASYRLEAGVLEEPHDQSWTSILSGDSRVT